MFGRGCVAPRSWPFASPTALFVRSQLVKRFVGFVARFASISWGPQYTLLWNRSRSVCRRGSAARQLYTPPRSGPTLSATTLTPGLFTERVGQRFPGCPELADLRLHCAQRCKSWLAHLALPVSQRGRNVWSFGDLRRVQIHRVCLWVFFPSTDNDPERWKYLFSSFGSITFFEAFTSDHKTHSALLLGPRALPSGRLQV